MVGSDDSGMGLGHDDATVSHGPSQKAMLRLVKVLGVVFVLLFLALVGGIIWKSQHRKVELVPDLMISLGIDPAAIRHVALSGNVLALTTDKEVVVVDVAKRSIVMRGKP